MGVEAGVGYIDDLVVTNPESTDVVAEGDDHLRLTKAAVKGSFTSLGREAVTKTAAEINDLATLTGTETLTNKTIVDPVIDGFPGGSISINSDTGPATLSLANTHDINDIPDWAKKITISFVNVSLNAADSINLLVGDSTSFKTAGYDGQNTRFLNAGSFTTTQTTSGLIMGVSSSGADIWHGSVNLDLYDPTNNRWMMSSSFVETTGDTSSTITIAPNLLGALTRLQVKGNSGAFIDAGSYTISYEG